MAETKDRYYTDGEHELEIKNIPTNSNGAELVHIRSRVRELAEELEQFGVKIVKVELRGG